MTLSTLKNALRFSLLGSLVLLCSIFSPPAYTADITEKEYQEYLAAYSTDEWHSYTVLTWEEGPDSHLSSYTSKQREEIGERAMRRAMRSRGFICLDEYLYYHGGCSCNSRINGNQGVDYIFIPITNSRTKLSATNRPVRDVRRALRIGEAKHSNADRLRLDMRKVGEQMSLTWCYDRLGELKDVLEYEIDLYAAPATANPGIVRCCVQALALVNELLNELPKRRVAVYCPTKKTITLWKSSIWE
ncbi:MAG: hypothetical protein QG604_913 [Candidatus Dependentiae bacterium]|nr:hypothetical protein [Candidatus Dependentiae bacterium]